MHAIERWVFPCKKSKTAIQKACDRRAIEDGDYHQPLNPPIRFKDVVLKNRDEADKWIDLNDSGWYDSLAVKFKDGRKINWLVKFEYHC